MSYQRILLALDLVQDNPVLVRRAGKFASRCGAKLHLLNVISPVSLNFWQVMTPHASQEGMQEILDATFAKLQILKDQLPCEVENISVVTGRVATEIERYAAEHSCDLLIIGHHQTVRFYQMLQLSMGEELLTHSNYDLLVLDDEAPFWSEPIKMLVATDFDERANPLLSRAAALSKVIGASMSLLYVMDLVQHAKIGLDLEDEADRVLNELEQKSEQQIRELVWQQDYQLDQLKVLRGSVSREIVSQAKSQQVDLVVMGGQSDEQERLKLGAHAQAVLHQGGGDVLVLRIPRHGQEL
ncbi:universal stress protein [Dongshaea marina]|uniref:universal stress protein n=1 Tax=Dongshaea marina TaxID=2047966 RepID=UPI000D3E60F5|nr:universal stress protein [Dongshaea marina]